MRDAGRLELGYYPLPIEEGHRLRRLSPGTEAFSSIDPCAGTGLLCISLPLFFRADAMASNSMRSALAASRSGIRLALGATPANIMALIVRGEMGAGFLGSLYLHRGTPSSSVRHPANRG